MNVVDTQSKTLKLLLIAFVLLMFFSLPFLPSLLSSADRYGLMSNRPAPFFNLSDRQGRQVSLQNYQNRFVFLMFGYTNCQDICHSQTALFEEVNRLSGIQNDLVFLYITMDPERDTAVRLASYFDNRSNNFISLRHNNIPELQEIAIKYHALFAHEGHLKQNQYDIRHAGFYYLIGPDGNIRQIYNSAQKQAHLVVSDLQQLRHEYQQL